MVPDLPKSEEILPWLKEIDANHWYSNFGPLSQRFEKGIVALVDSYHKRKRQDFDMVATSSGTMALEIGLSAYRLRPGTRVVLPSLTFPATATAVIRSGLIPVFADVDPNTWVLTPETAAAVVEKSGAKVVMPVASYGHRVNEYQWQDFASALDCQVLIDAAGAFPAQRPITDVDVCYSFHATKSLGIGEGGGLLSVDSEYLQTARELTNFGFGPGVVNTVGMNAKLSEYHAAVGLCQLERFENTDQTRREIYCCMRQLLSPLNDSLDFQSKEPKGSPTLFVTAVPGDADSMIRLLENRGVNARQWYCPPLHRHPAFDSHIKNLSLKHGSLATSEQLADRLIGLPFHLQLKPEQMIYIRNRLADALVRTDTRLGGNHLQSEPPSALA